MKSLSSVGLGLSIVFGCLLLALLAEVYYLLWWKKRLTNRDIENDYSNPAREFLYMFCWKRSSSSSSNSMSQTAALNPQGISSSNLLLKPADFNSMVENNNNHHLLHHHSLNSGPPRFLFTIIEETKEDLESEEAKSKCDIKSRVGSRGRSLSDLLLTVETPYLTPLASPPFFTPPLTPMEVSSGCNYSHQLGFNPLFESVTDAEFNRIKSSPPPKFKFLQEAEEKLHRKKMMEENEEEEEDDENGDMTPPSKYLKDEEDGSFITIIVDRSKEIRGFNHQCSSAASSQVLPLSSSPSTLIKSPV
ncbi:hypothetical protein CCACVL1_25225 [Corchorus capsularis]|uniref:Membrane lipoprotein n=1 Tax=Corchorus capsularis TaxID=210143 RepID=A0A1R3GLJ6_COCAP|nr:hypothetical protein CCACVL1_25225 [Corchorus capsularis]